MQVVAVGPSVSTDPNSAFYSDLRISATRRVCASARRWARSLAEQLGGQAGVVKCWALEGPRRAWNRALCDIQGPEPAAPSGSSCLPTLQSGTASTLEQDSSTRLQSFLMGFVVQSLDKGFYMGPSYFLIPTPKLDTLSVTSTYLQ